MPVAAREKIKKEIKQELLREFILPVLKEVRETELKAGKLKKINKISERIDSGRCKKFSSYSSFQKYLKLL